MIFCGDSGLYINWYVCDICMCLGMFGLLLGKLVIMGSGVFYVIVVKFVYL